MQKNIFKTVGICLISLLAASQAFANTDIKIMGGHFIWPSFLSMDTESLKPHGKTIHTIDPNFKADGITSFTGIGLKKIFDLAGIPLENGITIIAADQYVGYLSKEQVSQDMAILAWQMNDKPLGQLKGGPFKIVFPEQANVHGSCYTWYVDTLIAGRMDQAVLTVQVYGRSTPYTRKDLAPHARELPPNLLSIPQGCRNEFKGQQPGQNFYAIPLSRLIKPAEIKKAKRIKLIPLAGPAMTLKPEAFDYPVFIIVSYNKDALHPALGGPFSIIFPVEQHPGLKGLVPDSGALFFLEKIIIE
ncbi:MAG: molybdopterin-dependent oxidoreductase [Desulfobacteraceae bacterium]|nr:molybdopterin-dependent oxidoreductase [Desulfobacteraceae bacterium]